MQRIYSYILITLLLLSGNAWGRIWYVKPDSTGQAIHIQAGIDSCGYGDTVLVAPGIFRGDGNRDLDFKGKPIVVLAESRYDTTITDSTVIDCEGSYENCHRGFYFHSGETNASILEGLVITGGYSRSCGGEITWGLDCKGKPIVVMSADQFGSLIMELDCGERHRRLCFRSEEAHASILDKSAMPADRTNFHEEDRAIEYFGNEFAWDLDVNGLMAWDAEGSGGGILCDSSSSPTITHNTIRNCWAVVGGGICCKASSPTITHNNIDSNHAASAGCGIYCTSSSPLLAFNKIHNVYDYWHYANGVGIYCYLSSPTINHNDIYDNYSVYGPGAGICCDSCSLVTISSNEIYSNSAGDGTGAGISISYSSATIRENDILNNECSGASGIFIGSSTVTIVSNDISGNRGSTGVVTCSNSIATIDSNSVHDNNYGNTDPPSPTSGLQISYSRAVIRSNQISFNCSGGIAFWGDSSGTIQDNMISNNGAKSQSHGAIYCASPVSIIGNTIADNISTKYHSSGGVYCSSSALIMNNIIAGNSSRSYMGGGGGIYCDGLSPSIINNTVVGNEATRGSGILIGAQSHPTLTSNIISNNRIYSCEYCSNEGGGIYSESDSITISCCDVYDNEGGNYIGIPDQTGVNNNISQDPLFCPEGYPEFTLHSDSPCSPYINHACGLIGANPVACAQTDSDEFNKLISTYKLNQNYPNPFNPGTRIVFDLKEPSSASLKVYDVNGRLVRTLIAEKKESGRHEIAWDGKDESSREVASGVYFYRLNAGSFSETKKMVLLK
jgi:hypothetical protein